MLAHRAAVRPSSSINSYAKDTAREQWDRETFVYREAGRYRVCAWLEEGSEVDRVLGSPQYEQKFGVSCQATHLSTDERRALQLKTGELVEFK